MICASSRTGSSYLCQLLASTHVLGNPFEYFNTRGRRKRTHPGYPADRRLQIAIIRTEGATRNGVYGVKVTSPQLASLDGAVDPFRALPNLSFVRIRREDLLGQAISLARARQSQQFTAFDRKRAEPVYSTDFIRRCLRSVREEESIWDAVLARLRIQPLTVTYEEVLQDPRHVLDRIASLMGLVPPVAINPNRITLTIQRDDRSIEWRRRFLSETGDEFRELAL